MQRQMTDILTRTSAETMADMTSLRTPVNIFDVHAQIDLGLAPKKPSFEQVDIGTCNMVGYEFKERVPNRVFC